LIEHRSWCVTAALVLVLCVSSRSASAKELKIYISTDQEGATGVVHSDQDTAQTRKWMVEDINAAIQGALDAGATEIVVRDGHGSKRNINLSDLHPAASLISGASTPLGMMEGIDASFDAVLFVGYHARSGTQNAVMDHTNSSSRLLTVKVNGTEMPEFGLNSLVAGVFGVPVVLVTGDKAACDQTRELLGPDPVTVSVKEGIGRYAAKLLSCEKARKLIREGAKAGIEKRKSIKPYRLATPHAYDVTYVNTAMADNAMLAPGLKRVDPRTVRFNMEDPLAAFRFYRALIGLGEDD
jgi:D-amino peptidase